MSVWDVLGLGHLGACLGARSTVTEHPQPKGVTNLALLRNRMLTLAGQASIEWA